MYDLEISEIADKKFRKLQKREKRLLDIINKKILEIFDNPFHFKPLKGDLHGARRVHIQSSFVLTYEVIDNKIRILDFDHHDKIY